MIVTCSSCTRPEGFCLRFSENEKRSDNIGCHLGVIASDIEFAISQEVCAWCGGACCGGNMVESLPKKYLEKYDLPNEKDHCPAYDKETGCVLPRTGRPIACLMFECPLLEQLKVDIQMWQFCKQFGVDITSVDAIVHCNKCPHWNSCQYTNRALIISTH